MNNPLSHVVDALPGLVWTAHPNGQADFLNKRWLQYTGLVREEALGTGWHSCVHPEDLAEFLASWERMIVSGEAGEFEARMRRFDGVYRWFNIRANPLLDPDDKIIQWCGINSDIDNRKRTETIGRELQDRYRSIVDGLPSIVTLLSPDGHVEHANRHMLEYLGTTSEEMRGRAVGQAFHPEDRPEVLRRWERSAASGQPYDFEARLRRADGAYRWFHTQGCPLRASNGEISVWYFLQTDIEDRKRAEALLFGEKQLLEMVARGDSSPAVLDALCRLVESTADGCYCSVILADQSGQRVEQGAAPSIPAEFIDALIGRPINAESGPCGMATFLKEQVTSEDISTETRWPTWCPVAMEHGLMACWSTPISSSTGRALGAFAIYHREPSTPTSVLRELIEQFAHIASIAVEGLQSGAALKRSEAWLREAQHLSSTGSWYWRVAADTLEFSEQTCVIYELDPFQTITLDVIASRIHPEDLPILQEMIDIARGPADDLDYLYRAQMPDLSVKHLHLVAHGSRDKNGQLEYIGAIQDVTQRHLAEEALGRARSELAHVARVTTLGVLTASIAHEVNQPLLGIVTNASTCLRMLAADPPNIEGARRTAERSIRDGHSAADVITRLRSLFGTKGTTTEPVDLNEAAREVIALTSSELQRARVNLQADLAGKLPLVSGDRVQLQQVILNLLLNACDAMSEIHDRPRKLIIRTRHQADDRVDLSVQDVGAGLEWQDLEKLFEAFYTTKETGMGMGLSVSRSIIESHSGILSATPNQGPGATFSFSLPISESAESVGRTIVRIPPLKLVDVSRHPQ
ncbi:PAS domain-containing protein [Pararhizobium sp. PWRC1-1]|uniref:PAS domain-containing protein n=1 Tax=Pararhizobium sp. PWRC1-1 TaxID=2804566 RepID=UPI003CE88EBC